MCVGAPVRHIGRRAVSQTRMIGVLTMPGQYSAQEKFLFFFESFGIG
jgi:hypothetical protein